MKTVKLFHNPKAGAKKYSKKELVSLIETQGFQCIYSNVKKDPLEITEPNVDFIAVAGGDGTIRKVIDSLLKKSMIKKKYPLGILPLGTANNISKSINENSVLEDIIQSWHNGKSYFFDIGRISGLKEQIFFIEGIGFGAFAEFMHAIIEGHIRPSSKKIAHVLHVFKQKIKQTEESSYEIKLDGVALSGKFLLVEIMNITCVGPNLYFNPSANFDDGKFEIVLISKTQQQKFHLFLEALSAGKKMRFPFSVKKAKSIEIKSGKTYVHVDDQIEYVKELNLHIDIQRSVVKFLAW